MTGRAMDGCGNSAHQGLLRDVRRLKERLRQAETKAVALNELRTDAIRERVSQRLLRWEDFERYIGAENVVRADERIDWHELDVQMSALLSRRPELGVPSSQVGGMV